MYFVIKGLDGSVRSEERFLAINNFSANDDTFIFLLSTKAGEYHHMVEFFQL
jgi:SNF2 family DNA or RNA helicase